ncbi:RNA polymerase sigma factor [Micromonospora sp. NPDC005324]|uniref:RNA polymerase sigma factor n=1 Tax=Micromonospora sp. NPDC005324 TaxID=3157033 RepID=UPI0033B1B753
MSLRARVRAGKPEAFGQLFDDHSRQVYHHAFRLTGDWSTAEDIMALTFLEAWRLRAKVDPESGSLRRWLLGIATNVARNVSRAARRHAAAIARMPAAGMVPDFADDLIARVDDSQRIGVARRALARLHSSERDVFLLFEGSGLNYVECAQALGVPVGTVRSRLSRARRKLRKILGEKEVPDREPKDGCGQVNGDRENVVRPSQEMTR